MIIILTFNNLKFVQAVWVCISVTVWLILGYLVTTVRGGWFPGWSAQMGRERGGLSFLRWYHATRTVGVKIRLSRVCW